MENGKMTDKAQKNEAADRVTDRDKALAAAMSQIEKQFGKGFSHEAWRSFGQASGSCHFDRQSFS